MKIRKPLTMRQRNAVTGYSFISMFVIGVVFVFMPAVVQSFLLSLKNTDNVFDSYFIGLENYKWALLVDPDYIRQIVTTLLSLVSDVAIICFFALFISTLLNKSIRGKSVFRALMFLPVVASTGVVAKYMDYSATVGSGILTSGISETGGVFNADALSSYFASLSVSAGITNVIVGAIKNIYDIISRSGVQIVIFLAGLQAISPSVYEAAKVEGCTAWESFWKITLPMISPIVSVCCVYTVVDSFTGAKNSVMQRILDLITKDMEYGQATAMAFIYFALVALILALVLWLLNKVTYYE